VEWFDYSGYREYPQLWGSFVHEVSVLDLLFSQGRNSTSYLKFGRGAALNNKDRGQGFLIEERAA
jgi:hypothetical protein